MNDSTDIIVVLYIRITAYVLSTFMHISCALTEEKFLKPFGEIVNLTAGRSNFL